MMTAQLAKPASEPSKLIWVKCPFPLVTLGLEAGLKAVGHVYCEQEAPVKDTPSCVIYWPNGGDVASEVEQLRTVAGNIPILVLSLSVDPELTKRALLAGADGFIDLGMQPGQIVRVLSAAFDDKIAIPRDLLEALLARMVSQTHLTGLTPRQREFLELVVVASATFEDEIVSPKELLEDFLLGGEPWLRRIPHTVEKGPLM